MLERLGEYIGSFDWEAEDLSLIFVWILAGGGGVPFVWIEVSWWAALLWALFPTVVIVIAVLMRGDEFSTWPN